MEMAPQLRTNQRVFNSVHDVNGCCKVPCGISGNNSQCGKVELRIIPYVLWPLSEMR